mgnify:CR=1 FL=1
MALALPQAAILARVLRSALIETLGQDYVRSARAKGLSRGQALRRHALRNALIPVLTVFGLRVGTLLAGAVLTETIFSWPGIGKWLIDAISRRDYPVVQGLTLVLAVLVTIISTLIFSYGLGLPFRRVGPWLDF